MNPLDEQPATKPANQPGANTERQYDPFARTDQAESEYQKEERAEAEQGSPASGDIPGSPVAPGGPIPTGGYKTADAGGIGTTTDVWPNLSPEPSPDHKPAIPVPEGPEKPGAPEVTPPHQPEAPQSPQYPAPEIQVPFEPQRRDDPYDPMTRITSGIPGSYPDEVHNKGHMESAWQENSSDGELKRVFPAIQNHDNLEGTSDTADENWDGENKDLDIDSDSNRDF